jgi:hypothetical protein
MSSQIVARYWPPTADVPFPWVPELRLALTASFSQQRLATIDPKPLTDKLSRSPTIFTDSVADWLLGWEPSNANLLLLRQCICVLLTILKI